MPEQTDELCALAGVGPLFQRDYSATIVGTDCTPETVAGMLRERFPEFAPAETAAFEGPDGHRRGLEVGDELTITIALVGRCKVRVIHTDAQSLTLRTLCGHPEAGRITFGAGSDDQGRLVFRIRGRARASGIVPFLGFYLLGRQMQGRCWIRFIRNVGRACGGRIEGPICVKTLRADEGPDDRPGSDVPTFTRAGVG